MWQIKSLQQEKQAGDSPDIINEEIIVLVDKLLEYKCISKEQYKQFSNKYNLLHTKNK